MVNIAAPELAVAQWLNTDHPIELADLLGQVVVIEAFQMLCPACVTHGLPQAQRVSRTFGNDVAVIGLHSVFEHHRAMTPISLEAFLYEYRISFPVGVDEHETGVDVPITMRRYLLQGTPSMIVVDRAGYIRAHLFGQHDDLALGALIAQLCGEAPPPLANPAP